MSSYIAMSARRPETRLLAMISGVWMSRLVAFAVEEGVIDTLAERMPASVVAARLGFQAEITERLLDGLVHLGLASREDDGYGLTSDGCYLLADAPSGFASMTKLWNRLFDGAWAELAGTARTGRPGFELHHGAPIFARLGGDPATARLFDGAMRGLAGLIAREAAALIGQRGHAVVCDIGGGNGLLLSRILEASPRTRGILFDQPHVVAAVELPSIRTVGGDFFVEVPQAPAHVLSNVVHDWLDEDALRILRNVSLAQPADGTLYLVEMVLGGTEEPLLARSTDLNMLMLTGGREREKAAFERLLGTAGYEIVGMHSLADLSCLIEARKRPGA